MRFMIQCADGTVKPVTEDEGMGAMKLWSEGRPVIITRLRMALAPHMISKITPIKEWIDDEQQNAAKDRCYLCKYARRHKYDERCTCGQLRVPPAILLPDETRMLQISGPPPEERVALQEAPMTPDEKVNRKKYERMRDMTIYKMGSQARKKLEPNKDCLICKGQGQMFLPEHPTLPVHCTCITDQMHK